VRCSPDSRRVVEGVARSTGDVSGGAWMRKGEGLERGMRPALEVYV